jgi:hypothetical protein
MISIVPQTSIQILVAGSVVLRDGCGLDLVEADGTSAAGLAHASSGEADHKHEEGERDTGASGTELEAGDGLSAERGNLSDGAGGADLLPLGVVGDLVLLRGESVMCYVHVDGWRIPECGR